MPVKLLEQNAENKSKRRIYTNQRCHIKPDTVPLARRNRGLMIATEPRRGLAIFRKLTILFLFFKINEKQMKLECLLFCLCRSTLHITKKLEYYGIREMPQVSQVHILKTKNRKYRQKPDDKIHSFVCLSFIKFNSSTITFYSLQ